MAQITIQDILGSDNVAASRSKFTSNFKILADSVNKIETYLNTSPNGGDLNIATITVPKYSKPITDNILTVEASAIIAGNLFLGTTGSATTLTINSISTFKYDSTFKESVTFEKSIVGSGNSINIETMLNVKDIFNIPVNSDDTKIAVDNTNIDVSESTCINLDWNTSGSPSYTDVNFEDGVDGQIIIVRNFGTINDAINFNNADGTNIIGVDASTSDVTKSKMFFQFIESSSGNKWELISIVGLNSNEYTIG